MNTKYFNFPKIEIPNQAKLINHINKYTEEFIMKKNDLTTEYRCVSKIVDYQFDENIETKGIEKIYFYTSCFGFKVVDSAIIEGTSISNLLIYIEIVGTNSQSMPITKTITFDFPKQGYTNYDKDIAITKGIEIQNKFNIVNNTELYDLAKNLVIHSK